MEGRKGNIYRFILVLIVFGAGSVFPVPIALAFDSELIEELGVARETLSPIGIEQGEVTLQFRLPPGYEIADGDEAWVKVDGAAYAVESSRRTIAVSGSEAPLKLRGKINYCEKSSNNRASGVCKIFQFEHSVPRVRLSQPLLTSIEIVVPAENRGSK